MSKIKNNVIDKLNEKREKEIAEAYNDYFEVGFRYDMDEYEIDALHNFVMKKIEEEFGPDPNEVREKYEKELREYAEGYVEMAGYDEITNALDMGEEPEYKRQSGWFDAFRETLDECFYKDFGKTEEEIEDLYGGWQELREVQEDIFFTADHEKWDMVLEENSPGL